MSLWEVTNDFQHLSHCVYFTQGACLPIYPVCLCLCAEVDPYAVWDRAVGDVCMHNSVCHSYFNEKRRNRIHKRLWELKEMWIPFHGCLDMLQMCKCWKGHGIQITVYFHLPHSAINDMPKHWKHSKTWVAMDVDSTIWSFKCSIQCMWFIFLCLQTIYTNPIKLLLSRSNWTSRHLHYLQGRHRDYRRQCDSFNSNGV